MMPFDFPEVDKDGTPTAKLPNCPACHEDELGMIRPGLLLFCYRCGWQWEKGDEWPGKQPGKGIGHGLIAGEKLENGDEVVLGKDGKVYKSESSDAARKR